MAVTSTAPPLATRSEARRPVAPLESGDQLTAGEFIRRYAGMPEVKKAELIEGTVYMPSPVRREHAVPDTLVQGWLMFYSGRTPGTEAAGNATVRLDAENVPQPDALLRLLPESGGQTRVDSDGYFCGPPELIVEIAASSVAIDMHHKFRAYRRAGVREYLVWRTQDGQFDWFVLEQDEYRSNLPDSQGVIHSSQFPGLALAVDALLARDAGKVIDILQSHLSSPAHAAFVEQLAAKVRPKPH